MIHQKVLTEYLKVFLLSGDQLHAHSLSSQSKIPKINGKPQKEPSKELLDTKSKMRVYLLMLMTLQQSDIALVPLVMKKLKVILAGGDEEGTGTDKEANTSFFV